MRAVTVVPGPPGTGKTRRCLGAVEDALRAGSAPDRIAYVSFTRAAVHEGKRRAVESTGVGYDDLPYFRTLHSLALFLLGASTSELLSRAQLAELAELLGEPVAGFDALDEAGEPRVRRPAATALFLDQLARNRRVAFADAYAELPLTDRPPRRLVERAAKAYRRFRIDTGALDFTDLLERATTDAEPPPLDLAVVDEAQDLTPLQWAFVERVFADANRVLVAGDDDQAIFRWAGADPSAFVELEGDVEPLTKSHRLPREVYRVATKVAASIRYRRQKAFSPRGVDGDVVHHRRLDSVPIDDVDRLLLARHGRDVNAAARELRRRGVPYRTKRGWSIEEKTRRAIAALRHWSVGDPAPADDARAALAALGYDVPVELPEMVGCRIELPIGDPIERVAWHLDASSARYLRAVAANGYDPLAVPSTRLSTIHGAKGAEADTVVVVSKLNRRTADAWRRAPDDERRVLYVALTRARRRLDLVEGGYRYEYPFRAFDV